MKINFESSTTCNAKCVMCPLSDMTRKKGQMSDKLFHKIIKEGKEMRVKYYSPFLMGEPFIFPKIWDWLSYMEKEGVYFSIYTNAEFLDVDRLLSYKNIWYINCSLNAATKETHKKVMNGPDFERCKKNIDEMYLKAQKKGISMRVSFVMNDDNIHELEAFKKMYHRRRVCGFANWTGEKKSKVARKGEKQSCWVLMNQMTILWDGKVVPCCMDFDGKMVLGDANTQHLRDIWNSYSWMRSKHRHGEWDDIPICKKCNYNSIAQR